MEMKNVHEMMVHELALITDGQIIKYYLQIRELQVLSGIFHEHNQALYQLT